MWCNYAIIIAMIPLLIEARAINFNDKDMLYMAPYYNIRTRFIRASWSVPLTMVTNNEIIKNWVWPCQHPIAMV